MSRVLVTGADGFIGRHLCAALHRAGHKVTPWDLPLQDITKPCTSPEPLDAVVHLAAVASPIACDRDPGTAFRVNVQGTHNVLKAAMAAGAKRLILASSAHVYGISPKYLPSDERHPLWLQDVYTTSKILSEQVCQLFYDNHGLSYASLRLFNGYGPGQKPGYFIPDMIQQAKAGRIELRGHQMTKDWVYIDDVVRAYVLALESQFVGPINIGTGVETTLEVIARRVADSFGAEVVIRAPPKSGPTRMLCDWSRAKRVLGWEPQVTIEDGFHRTLAALA